MLRKHSFDAKMEQLGAGATNGSEDSMCDHVAWSTHGFSFISYDTMLKFIHKGQKVSFQQQEK